MLGQFADLSRGMARKRGVMFLTGRLIPRGTLCLLDDAIKGTSLNLKFVSLSVPLYLIKRRTNRVIDIFKLGSIDEVRMRARGRGKEGVWSKA